MHSNFPVWIAVLCVAQLAAENRSDEMVCGGQEPKIQSLSLRVASKRNMNGQWITSFFNSKDESSSNERSNITLDVTNGVTECGGRRTVIIKGVIQDESPLMDQEGMRLGKLLFHTKCSSNAAVVNMGRTVQKINLEEPIKSVAFTNRPLKDNEIFEVRLEKKNSKFPHCLSIGVTTHSPLEISIPDHINRIAPPSWAMYHNHFYQNGSLVLKSYGRNLDSLEVGDRVGVMRSDTGSLHFYINGVDQGPAASNVPSFVYGLLELYYNAAMATIVW